MTILINNVITIQGTVDECIEFLKKYEDNEPKIYNIPDSTDSLIKLPLDFSNCSECLFYQKLNVGDPYVGDTPCNWCKKRQPICGDF